jgi:RNA-directed DNA polymerase
VLELAIKSVFDTIDGELLLRALRRPTDGTWGLLDIERWLKAPVSRPDGTLVTRNQGTPQGAVISPLRAHVFLHEVFDGWMTGHDPDSPFERYADDSIGHCGSEEPARALKDALAQRVAQGRRALHPHKTRLGYGKEANRRGRYPDQRFDFLG